MRALMSVSGHLEDFFFLEEFQSGSRLMELLRLSVWDR